MERIVIAGGGIMGSVHRLSSWRCAGAASAVTVLEPDPTYELAATPRAVGGIRLQHAICARTCEMSLLWRRRSTPPSPSMCAGGKVELRPAVPPPRLSLSGARRGRRSPRSKAIVRMQREPRRRGRDILDAAELRRRYPVLSLRRRRLRGALSPADGQVDPYAALMGFRRAAEGLGIAYVKDRRGRSGAFRRHRWSASASRPRAAACPSTRWSMWRTAGRRKSAPWSAWRCRSSRCAASNSTSWRSRTIEPIPAMRHMDGLAVRTHQDGYIVGAHQSPTGGFNWELEHQVFESVLWPQLAEQCAAFEAIKLEQRLVRPLRHEPAGRQSRSSTASTRCRTSSSPPASPAMVCMHAPAVGRAVKELLLDGGFRSIDLSRLRLASRGRGPTAGGRRTDGLTPVPAVARGERRDVGMTDGAQIGREADRR